MSQPDSKGTPKQISERDRYVGGARAFLLLGLMLTGIAIYKYWELDTAEQEGKLLLMWEVFARLYWWGGKWAVAAPLLGLAGVCFTTGIIMQWVVWKKDRAQKIKEQQFGRPIE